MEFVTAELAALSRRMRWHTQIVRLAESGEALGTARRFAQELVRYHTPEAVRHRGGLDIVASITGMPMNVGAELADLVDRHAAAASPTSPERERTISQALLTAVRRSAASQLPEIVSRLLQNYI